MFGYMGKILHVNLSKRKLKTTNLSPNLAKLFIGGKGLGAKLLYDMVEPNTDPYSPENIVVFTTGPFDGTPVPLGCRYAIVTKSPLSNSYVDTNSGGFFGPYLRFSGYDLIIIEGRADKPYFLYIEEGSPQLLDAGHLWGKTTHETENIIHKDIDKKASIASIGPAGENLVRYACVTNDSYRNAGRGGSGTVLGSKKLKAIAVYGTKQVPIAQPEKLRMAVVEIYKKNRIDRLGTPSVLQDAQDTSSLPTRNFQQGWFEEADKINGETMRKEIVVKDVPCYNCTRACGKLSVIKSGPWKGTTLVGPEYETLGMMGSNCGINDLGAIAYANLLCDQLGLDTISTGVVIGFVMECYERGILTAKELDGLKPTFGNAEAMMPLIKKIAYRKGIGNLLAEGVKRVAEKIGKGSEQFACHVKGAELPAWEARGVRGRGLMYALCEGGGFHTKGWVSGSEPPKTSAIQKVKKFITSQNKADFRDSNGLCMFLEIEWEEIANLLNLVTGWKLTRNEYLETGERIHTLTRAFNVREGFSRKDDKLPPRQMNEPTPKGKAKGCKAFISEEDFEKCLDKYYRLRGWGKEGKPTYNTLVKLGLKDVAEDLKKRKIIASKK
jgi:aldehyde:ferredoxin oxidoreductase